VQALSFCPIITCRCARAIAVNTQVLQTAKHDAPSAIQLSYTLEPMCCGHVRNHGPDIEFPVQFLTVKKLAGAIVASFRGKLASFVAGGYT